jgi:hypothetical protein
VAHRSRWFSGQISICSENRSGGGDRGPHTLAEDRAPVHARVVRHAPQGQPHPREQRRDAGQRASDPGRRS